MSRDRTSLLGSFRCSALVRLGPAPPKLAQRGQAPGLRAAPRGRRPQPGVNRGHSRRWRWRDARPGSLPCFIATASVVREGRGCGEPLVARRRPEGERGAGVWWRRGLGLLAGSHAPHERQPGGPAAPGGVRFAVEQLVTVAGTFAVGHRTAARTRASAHRGPVLRAAVPSSPRVLSRVTLSDRLDRARPAHALELLGCSFLFERLAGFLCR
jgi:hypothetical protein